MAHGELFPDEALFHHLVGVGIIIFGVVAFILLFVLEAPYGRYNSSSWIWGPPLPATFAWILQECPTLIAAVYFFFFRADDNLAANQSLANRILLFLFVFHYTNRTLVYPFRLRGGKPTPLIVCLMAFAFCVANGYLQVRNLLYFQVYDESWLRDPRFVVGVLAFFLGWYINTTSDDILRNLRKPGETGYKIPKGFMFEYVSGANFFGEILEWTGFAIACWSLPAAIFALFTFSNIGPRGWQHHRWYQTKFENYPKNRKAVIPFLW
eukprot:TRINITY_DN7749_c0_g1_i1.p1 TRINITY_DN7749_c0_g1~~TRINITY_DN7749_c0_g1_i1.p1  ORF type:complete len:281 (-),score=70.01 TRINITY_DN7749_c0_g1_i1:83-880(-)